MPATFMEVGETVFRCAIEHNFGFLRIQLKNVNKMPIIDCICALPQISELIRHAVAGEDREETCVICILMERYFDCS